MNIDPKIEADTLAVCTTEHSHVRLMNDSRWPWLIVLPRDSDSTELHHLSDMHRAGYLKDINRLSGIIQQLTLCRSVNIAMLGNVVSALHCHVVARDEGDPNWPKTIWGFEDAIVYEDKAADELIQTIRNSLAS